MKKFILSIALLVSGVCFSQFRIEIEATDTFANKKVLIYTLSGSKDFIAAQANKNKGKWEIAFPSYYKGMLRAYFPENNQSVSFISENKNIGIKLATEGDKLIKANYEDEANRNWNEVIQLQRKKDEILPVLSQIKTFYNDGTPFAIALENEIERLKKSHNKIEEESFLKYYLENSKYAYRENKGLLTDDYKQILMNSGDMLESSSLMRPILVNYLGSLSRKNLHQEIDGLLNELNLETPRGQTVLAELLSIFEAYGLEEEKQKYYQKASALTCSINRNLEESIKVIKNTAIGAVFEDYAFTSKVKNTKRKRLSDVKADKKVILFWSSTCPHCISELPIILENYNSLKSKGIEVIAISLDTDKTSYEEKTEALPWINDTELKGWRSSFVEKYNINATPTYYILDRNHKIVDKPANFSIFLSSLGLK